MYMHNRTLLLHVAPDGANNRPPVRKLGRIGQQILNDLSHTGLVADQHLRKFIFHTYNKLNRFLIQIHQADMCLFFEQIIKIIFFLMQYQLSGFQFGIYEDGIDLLKQIITCITNVTQHSTAL